MATIYLSGPMSGLPDRNAAEFDKWAKFLRERHYQVISPVENDNRSIDKPRSFYMEMDLSSLMVSDIVVLLPNWQYSRGAKLEVAVAQEIGRKIYTIEEFIKPRPVEFIPEVIITIS